MTEQQEQQQQNEETNADGEPETFPREYVEKLRSENAEARIKAKRADDLASKLMESTVVSATAGILADPTDLSAHTDVSALVDDDGFPDVDKIKTAATELAESKPHLAPRTPSGDVGQGAREQQDTFSLADTLRSLT